MKVLLRSRLLWVAVLYVAAIALATVGWLRSGISAGAPLPTTSLIDAVWNSVTVDNYFILRVRPEPQDWPVVGAKLLARAAVLLFAATSIEFLFHRHLSSWWFRRKVGWRAWRDKGRHIVVVGLGERGSALARSLVVKGELVSAIEMKGNGDAIGELRAAGVTVVVGNALDDAVFMKLRPDLAKEVYAVCGQDETNMALAAQLAKQKTTDGKVALIAGVESSELRLFFRDRLAGALKAQGRELAVRLVGYREQACLGIVRRHAKSLIVEVPSIQSVGLRALIHAAADVRPELLRAAGVMLQVSPTRVPSICLAGTTPADRRRFDARCPEASLAVNLHWSDSEAEAAWDEVRWGSAHLAIFALESDARTLEAADRFARRNPESRVVACLRDTGELAELTRHCTPGVGVDLAQCRPVIESLYGFGRLGSGTAMWSDPEMDDAAKKIHGYYLSLYGGKQWKDLPEHLRESNRLCAAHNEIKRVLWERCEPGSEEALIRNLLRMEHHRWNAEKVLDGWRRGEQLEKKDDYRLQHGDLLPFDELPLKVQYKDYGMVCAGLGINPATYSSIFSLPAT